MLSQEIELSLGEFFIQIYGYSFVMIAAIIILIAGREVWFKNKGWAFIGIGISGLIIRSIGSLILISAFSQVEYYDIALSIHIIGIIIFCGGLIIGLSYLYLEFKSLEEKEAK